VQNEFCDFADRPLGVCEPLCNPVSQVRLTDGAANCGATILTPQPNRGCYANGTVDGGAIFACAPAGMGGHGVRAQSFGNTAFINGCAPGFLPIFPEPDGGPRVLCAATCTAKPTSVASPQDAGGVAPFSCAARGALLAECRYFRWVGGSTSEPWGVCFDYREYRWDHDGNVSTPDVPVPSCTTLTTAPSADGGASQASFWGCVP
jgi:hypothetical protein